MVGTASLLNHHRSGPLICTHKPKGTEECVQGLSVAVLVGYFTLPSSPRSKSPTHHGAVNYSNHPELHPSYRYLPFQHSKAPRPSFSTHSNQGSGFSSHPPPP